MVFFFPSRRRHTKSDRDWSSDVCSSDLESKAAEAPGGDEPPRGRQRAPVLETARAPYALADDDAQRVRLRGDVARVAQEHPPEFGAEPGRGRPDRRSFVHVRLPLARSDHGFGQHAELLVDRGRSSRDTRDGPDRFEQPSLPGDGDVVLESPCHHEEVGTVSERGGQERLRVAKRRLERDRAHDIERGSPGSRFYAAPDASTEGAAPGVEDRGPPRTRAVPDEFWQTSKIVAGRAQHADDMRGSDLGDRVGRAAVVPEDLPVRSGEGRDGERRSTPVRSEEQIDALFGQQPRHILPRARRAARVIERDEAEWAVGSIPTERQASGARDMIYPEPDPVARFLPLAAQRSAH